MNTSKLRLAVNEAEGALKRLQELLDQEPQDTVGKALLDLQNELQTIKAVVEVGIPIVDPQSPPEKKYIGWRVLHKAEGGYDENPLNMPSVIPPLNPEAVEMTEEIQQMSFALMKHFNPDITSKRWTAVHDHDRAFTNKNGFGKKTAPRRNFITSSNPGAPLPKYDKAQRLTGGQFVRGEVRGDKLVCIPGIHGIDANQPMPSIQTIVDNNWYMHAITLFNKKTKVGHFPQGQGGPVVIPFIFAREIEFPLEYFENWESDELPDPLKMYKLE